MGKNSSFKPSRIALPRSGVPTAEELVEIARSQRSVAPFDWTAVVRAVEREPEKVVRLLQAESQEIPEHMSNDPIISGLRRIAWPSDRLPIRHRRALAEIGKKPLVFARLCLEEARTWAWRSLKVERIIPFAQWAYRCTLKDIDKRAALELAIAARVYESILAVRFGEPTQFISAMDYMTTKKKGVPADSPFFVEALLGMGLFFARVRSADESERCFSVAEETLEGFTGEEVGELRTYFDLCRAWSAIALRKDHEEAEEIYIAALGAIDPQGDPWLPLFLRHEAALAGLVQIISRIKPITDVECAALEKLADPRQRAHKILHTLTRGYTKYTTTDHETLLRVLAYLEAADLPYRELRTPEFMVDHSHLLAHALIIKDPVKSLHYLGDAMDLSLQQFRPERVHELAGDACYLFFQLEWTEKINELVRQAIDRIWQLIKAARIGTTM